MKFPLSLAVAIAAVAFSARADAQVLDGSVSTVVDPFTASASMFTVSSFSLNQTNLITSDETGDFTTLVPALGDLTASTATISGLSATPITDSISDFLQFSSSDSTLNSLGTSPTDRFEFNLATIAETSFTGSAATFEGTGTIIDTTGQFQPTTATLVLAYSSQKGYTLTLETVGSDSDPVTVPEPSTWALMLGGLSLLVLFGRRVRRA